MRRWNHFEPGTVFGGLLCLLFALLFAWVVGPRSAAGHEFLNTHNPPFEVSYVIHGMIANIVDGDTFDLDPGDGEPLVRIRFWGIDAPEMDTEAGREATVWARENWWFDDVSCYVEKLDRWGRSVAMCYRGSWNIAWEIIRAGHAIDWPKYSGGYYAVRLY